MGDDESLAVRLGRAMRDTHGVAWPASWRDQDFAWVGRQVAAALQAEAPAPAGLDAAWDEVEAALPEGWDLWWVSNDPHHGNPAGPWNAVAGLRAPEDPTLEQVRSNKQAYGPTPAAALRSLIAALTAQEPA